MHHELRLCDRYGQFADTQISSLRLGQSVDELVLPADLRAFAKPAQEMEAR